MSVEAIVSLLKHEMAFAEANGFQRSTLWMSRETTDTICAALTENARLRDELAIAQGANKAMAERIDGHSIRGRNPV